MVTMDKIEKPYCFGNYSDCACNECLVVDECVKRLAEKNAEYEKSKNKTMEEDR